jgi:hypothetical protein
MASIIVQVGPKKKLLESGIDVIRATQGVFSYRYHVRVLLGLPDLKNRWEHYSWMSINTLMKFSNS